MKKSTVLLLLVVSALLFTGCFETTEELTLNENGSGTYHYAMNLNGLFDMLETMKAMDSSGNMDTGFPKERKDTTIHLRSFTDTATSITAEQKALYQNGTVHLLMDASAKEFQMDMNLPFQKTSDVQRLMKLLSSNEGGGMLSKLFQNSKMLGNEAGSSGNDKMPDLNSFFDMTIAKKTIERRLNKAKYDSLMQQFGNQMQMEQMEEMFSNIKMNTIIHLPHAAKKVTGKNAVAATDKKTITLKGTLLDLFVNPEVFSYRIEY